MFYFWIAFIWWFTAVLFLLDGRDIPIAIMNSIVGFFYFCVFVKENRDKYM